MGRICLGLVLCLLLQVYCSVELAQAQPDRRDRREPELVVETGARMGACDALTFTPDGKQLLAAGDDKVVRIWNVTDKGLDAETVKTIRWPSWREQRGAIYALALSPHHPRHVTIAGYGMRTGTIAELDLVSSQVVSVLTDVKGNDRVIWSLAHSKTSSDIAFGTGDGSVWLWKRASTRPKSVVQRSRPAPGRATNRVRLVAFLTDDKHLLWVTEDGSVQRAGAVFLDDSPKALFRFESAPLFRAALSPDQKWLAAAGEKSRVEVRSLDGKLKKDIELPAGHFPHSLAFDAKSERLAVGVRVIDRDADFFKETDDYIHVYELKRTPQRLVFEAKVSYHPEALAFHPDGKRLASAGGDDHEVILWDLNTGKKQSEIRGPGNCLWGVALSRSGRHLSIRAQRNTNPANPNDRAAGPWQVFDLEKRRWTLENNVDRLMPLKTAGGWKVEFSTEDVRNAYTWFVVNPTGKRFVLPLDRDRDGMPRCYSFLPDIAGKPVRLAVGHYWGLSIFELTEQGPRRTRLYTGHQGEVMSLGLSADFTWLVSAGRDQAVSAWSLADWPSQAELGAKFRLEKSKIFVDAVDVGSPAWEAGLLKGDEIVLFAFDRNQFLYDPNNSVSDTKRTAMKINKIGTAVECAEQLHNPVPGKEFYFKVKRGQREVELLTTIRQRPLWRFFPTRNREWVLWMWRSYYYDTSTNGDFLIGWHVNNRDPDREPTFYRAEQFRKHFHRPEVIDKLLGSRNVEAALRVATTNPLPPAFDTMEPPAVRIEVIRGATQREGDIHVALIAEPRGDNPDHQPQQVDLWINDYRFQSWQAEGQPFRTTVVIPAHRFRAGVNQLTLQAYNILGGRAEATARVTVAQTQPTEKPKLYALLVGINDYSKAQPAADGKRFLGNLRTATRDAEAMKKSWSAQKGKLYQDADLVVHLNKDANREAILKTLKQLAGRVRPEDRVLIFLAGHGDFLTRVGLPETTGGESTFIFCCPDYDRKRYAQTGITSQTLYETLALIPGRKVVILDACHSGEAVANPIRSLTPGGKGPIILAACDRSEFSFEHEKFGHGLFTYAVLEALGPAFERADRDRNGTLDAAEVFTYAQARLPELLKEIKRAEDDQNPISFPAKLESYPLAQKP